MKAVYLDHCTSAFPKAPGVGEAMARAILRPGRTEDSPAAVGEKLLKLAHAPAGSVLRFTPGADWGLGWLLSALLRPGDKVLASPMERGSVLRALEGCPGVTVELLPCTRQGELILDGLEEKLTHDVKAVVLTHASHVSGDLFPMAAVGALCRARDICFLADGAQTFGVLPVDMAGWGVDGLVFPGHTGLLGPEGMGGLALSPRLAALLPPFPDDSLNLPGIAGLGAALDYLAEEGERLTVRLGRLSRHLWARMKELDGEGLRVLGRGTPHNRAGLVSVEFTARPNGEMARLLAERYGIRCAWGTLDAPLACRTLGCSEQGVVRFSVSPFTTFGEIDWLEGAVEALL